MPTGTLIVSSRKRTVPFPPNSHPVACSEPFSMSGWRQRGTKPLFVRATTAHVEAPSMPSVANFAAPFCLPKWLLLRPVIS